MSDLFEVLKWLFVFVGALGVFLYGMKLMSEAVQKLAGDGMRSILSRMTSKPFNGILTGLVVTTATQSSSATTVMVVSFVNAGLISLAGAIGIIMGANIGSTVTSWIISIFGLKFSLSAITLPMVAISLPFIFSSNAKRKSLGEFLIGFSLLFLGLDFMTDSIPDVSQFPEVLKIIASWSSHGYLSIILFALIGAVFTMIAQASSAIMAVTLFMCNKGWIGFDMAVALVMGQNIGTTITANLAAMVANVTAKKAALAHLIFNLVGVILCLVVFYPFMHLLDNISMNLQGMSPYSEPSAIPLTLSLFHTIFNVANTLILVGFIPQLIKLVNVLVKSNKEEDEEFRLKFISGGMMSTAELSIVETFKETGFFAERVQKMFGFDQELLYIDNEKDHNKLLGRIEKYEKICDNLELEIGRYINKISEGKLSAASKQKTIYIYREVSEIESIGDSCYNLSRHINTAFVAKAQFTDSQHANIKQMFNLVDFALNNMVTLVKDHTNAEAINKAYELESEINDLRAKLKVQNISDVGNQVYDYQLGVWYMDIITECEKIGDYIINVIEARTETSRKAVSQI